MILELTLSPAGTVEAVEVKHPLEGATDAAVAAVEQWSYEPLVWDGEAVWCVLAVVLSNPFTF